MSVPRRLRDDFGIKCVQARRVALTREQVNEYHLPGKMKASDKKSSNRHKFIAKYGDDVFELDALPAGVMATLLEEDIDSIIDIDLFNRELAKEQEELAYLAEMANRARAALAGIAKGGGR